jgi:ATP-binding cassette subfamily C protein CydD
MALEALSEVGGAMSREAAPGIPAGRKWPREVLVVRTPLASFSLAPGEIVAVVGRTGSGKTTLLRTLLGLEPCASGSIRYGSTELDEAGVGPGERPFAWVPQEAPVVTGTLAENVALATGDLRSVRRCEGILAWIGAEQLLSIGLHEKLGAGGRPVSGGERQWISLARAIASGLPVLLLDEPTAGLDAGAAARVLVALGRLRATHAVILVTHQREPLAIADRVIAVGSDASLHWEGVRTAPRTEDRFRT